MEYLLDYIKKTYPDSKEIYLNVQINNDEAINFYQSFGFKQIATQENYYKRIEPSTALTLSLTI